MKSMHIRKDDTVQVITGKDRGKHGRVLSVFPQERRVLVEGVNRCKKHVRATQTNPQGGIIDWELPLDVSDVMLLCPSCGRPTRISRDRGSEGDMERVCKKCDAHI